MTSWAADPAARRAGQEEAEPGSFEYSALLAFRALAALAIAGIVFAFFALPGTISLLLALTFNVAAALLAVVYLLIARGLLRLQEWAIAAARPVLVLVAIADIAIVVSSLANGHIRLPIASALAIWALRAPAGVVPGPRAGRFVALILVLVIPLLGVLGFSHPVFDWGGALDVHEENLVASLEVSCGSPDDPAGTGPPASLQVTYDWGWTKRTPVPSGLDIVVIGWSGVDALERPLYLLGELGPATEGVYQGRRSYPSLEMALAIASATRGSWQWGVELDEQQLAPGRITFELDRSRAEQPGATSVRITASYIHLGLWHVETAPVTCAF